MLHEAWWVVLCRERAIAGCGVHTFPGLLLQSPSSLTLWSQGPAPGGTCTPSLQNPQDLESWYCVLSEEVAPCPQRWGVKWAWRSCFVPDFSQSNWSTCPRSVFRQCKAKVMEAKLPPTYQLAAFPSLAITPLCRGGAAGGSIWSPEISAHKLPLCLPGRFTGHSKLGGLLHLNKSLVQTEGLPLKMFKNKTLK